MSVADSGKENFWRRNFRPPSAFGIIVITLVSAVVAGFLSALVWSVSDDEQPLGAPTPPISPAAAEPPPSVASTTTTRPDLSLEGIDEKVRPQVWTVSTLDAAGQPSVGSAFSAGLTEGRTVLITSLAVVEAGTRAPGPEITVQNGSYESPATLWTWEEGRDLAVLTVPRSSQAAVPWADENRPVKAGDRIFAVAADRVTPGVVSAPPGGSVQHNIFVEDPMRGAPLVNIKGEVVAVASAAYTAGGTPTDTAFFGIPIRTACAKVLTCPGYSEPGAPAGSTTTTRRGTTTTRRGATTTTTSP